MKKGNMTLLAASAVVVVLVLVFSYIQFGGEEPEGPRTGDEFQLGDYLIYEYTNPDGTDGRVRVDVIRIVDDKVRIHISNTDGTEKNESYRGFPFGDDWGVLAGTEVIDTLRGEMECLKYVDEDNDVYWVHDRIVYSFLLNSLGGITVDLVGSSIFEPHPPANLTMDPRELKEGDWRLCREMASPDVIYQIVDSIEGDRVTVRTVSATEFTVLGVETMPMERYLTGMTDGLAYEYQYDELVSVLGKWVLTQVYNVYEGDTIVEQIHISDGICMQIEKFDPVTGECWYYERLRSASFIEATSGFWSRAPMPGDSTEFVSADGETVTMLYETIADDGCTVLLYSDSGETRVLQIPGDLTYGNTSHIAHPADGRLYTVRYSIEGGNLYFIGNQCVRVLIDDVSYNYTSTTLTSPEGPEYVEDPVREAQVGDRLVFDVYDSDALDAGSIGTMTVEITGIDGDMADFTVTRDFGDVQDVETGRLTIAETLSITDEDCVRVSSSMLLGEEGITPVDVYEQGRGNYVLRSYVGHNGICYVVDRIVDGENVFHMTLSECTLFV